MLSSLACAGPADNVHSGKSGGIGASELRPHAGRVHRDTARFPTDVFRHRKPTTDWMSGKRRSGEIILGPRTVLTQESEAVA